MNVSLGIVWDCVGLTSFNGPDKLIDQCCPDPMIPGYLHVPSRSGESSPRAQSLIIIPKLAGSGWLAGWLARWLAQLLLLVGWLAIGLASCSWLAAWLAACCVADEADEGDDSGCGWLAGWLAGNQTKTPSKRNISLSVAELKVHEKNIQKRRRQAGGYKS